MKADQYVAPGTERSKEQGQDARTAKQRQIDELRLKSRKSIAIKAQKEADHGMFGTDAARGQGDLLSETPNGKEAGMGREPLAEKTPPAEGRAEQPERPAVEGTRDRPADGETDAGREAARERIDHEATPAQKDAGNYEKGHIDYKGLPITIETAKGEMRTSKDLGPDGKPTWQVKMPVDYGYIKGTTGNDHEQVDVFVGDHHDSDKAYVIEQRHAETKDFDEHKVMLGFENRADAVKAYKQSFSDGKGWARLGKVLEFTVDGLKRAINQFMNYKGKPSERGGINLFGPKERKDLSKAAEADKVRNGDPKAMRDAAAPIFKAQEGGDLRSDYLKSVSERIRGPNKIPTWQRVRDAINIFKDGASIQSWVDRLHSIGELEKATQGQLLDASRSAYKASRLSQGISATMSHVLKSGPVRMKDGWFAPVEGHPFKDGFEGLFSKIQSGSEMELYKDWMIAQRAGRLMGEGREHLLTRDEVNDINRAAAQDPQRLARFRKAFGDYQEFNKAAIQNLVDVGRMSKEQAQFWTANADYLPFYRLFEEANDPKLFGEHPTRAPGAKLFERLKGGPQQLGDPIENMVMNLTKVHETAMKTEAFNRIIPMALESGQITKADTPNVKWSDEQIQTALDRHGVHLADLDPAQQERWRGMLGSMLEPPDPNTVTGWKDGVATRYTVHDPMLMRSIEGLTPKQLSGFVRFFGGPRRLLTFGVTIRPDYMVRNAARDTLATWAVSGVKGFNPIKEAPRSLRAAMKDSPSLQALRASGSELGSFYSPKPKSVRDQIETRLRGRTLAQRVLIDTPAKAYQFYQKIGAATEQANRIAVFDHLKAQGATDAEAAYQAMDLMDFNMGGDGAAARFLAHTIPFLNARIQGLYRIVRGATMGDRAQKLGIFNKQFLYTGALLTLATLALQHQNEQDPRYEALEDWEKDSYWHAWIGGQHFMFPKPMEVGSLFGTLPERFTRLLQGRDDSRRFASRMLNMATETLAIDARPQIIKPLLELHANRDSFTGRPIESDREKGMLPEARYNSATPMLARGISKMVPSAVGDATQAIAGFNLKSPKVIDKLGYGYTSGLWTMLNQGTNALSRSILNLPRAPEMRAADMPMIGSFFKGNDVETSRYITDFYDAYHQSEALMSTIREYRTRGEVEGMRTLLAETKASPEKQALKQTYQAFANTSRNLNRLERQIRSVTDNSTMSSAEKRQRIDSLTTRRNLVAQRAMEILSKAKARQQQPGG